jgi:arylsulfatase A-like enzyme
MSFRLRLLAVLVCALACAHCGRSERRPPNVLVVVIDTLRADRLGAYGNQRGLTPFLDTLARKGTLFEHAYAVSSWTIPSTASLFTSRYPTQHHVVTFGSVLAAEEVTLAERLRDAGWIAGGFSANPNLRADRGYAQGFDRLWTDPTADVDVPGDTVRSEALGWLDSRSGSRAQQPAMLYLQYMEPHAPYNPREPFRSRFVVDVDGKPFDPQSVARESIARLLPDAPPEEHVELGELVNQLVARGMKLPDEELPSIAEMLSRGEPLLYDGDVAMADDQVRRLFDELDRRGLLSDTVVIVTADHGEEFLEHGRTSHGRTLYEECVRVPLIVVGPGIPAGLRLTEKVSLLDVAPTLLDLLGLPPETRFEGRSLLPLMRGTDPGSHDAPDIMLQLERAVSIDMDQEHRIHSRGFIRGSHKLLLDRDGSPEVYDLASDPGERSGKPIAGGEQERMLRAALSLVEAQIGERTASAPPPAPVDEATRQRLRALGYTP